MSKWLTHFFIITLIVVFAALWIVAFLGGSWSYNSLQTNTNAALVENQTMQSIQQTRNTSTALSIFWNNFLASALLLVPAVGLVFFLVTMWNTGQIIGIEAASVGISPIQYFRAIFFPVGVLEFGAYAVLGAEITCITALIVVDFEGAKERFKNETWKSILLYFALLAIAAYIEASLL